MAFLVHLRCPTLCTPHFFFLHLRRQHLLTDTPTQPPASSVIVMKGLLDPEGVVAGTVDGDAGGRGGHAASPREWTLIVNRVEGSIVRFLAGGVDLIEPGGGNTNICCL